MANQKLTDFVATWELLRITAQTELADMPHATADLAELDRLIQAGSELAIRRAALRESLAGAGRERLDLIQSGSETYRRLTLGLRSKLGPRSVALLRFGVTPQRPARRKPPAAPPIEMSAPVSSTGKEAEAETQP